MAQKIVILSVLWMVLFFIGSSVPMNATSTPETVTGTTNPTFTPGNETGTPVATSTPGSVTGTPVATSTPGSVTGTPVATSTPGNETGTPVATSTPGSVTGTPDATASTGNVTGTPDATASTGNVTGTPDATVSPTQLPNPCIPNPCRDGATCEPHANMTFMCQCLSGEDYNYVLEACVAARVFRGQFQTTEPYEKEMNVTTSEGFQRLSNLIIADMEFLLQSVPDAVPVVLELRRNNTEQGAVATRETVAAIAIVETRFPATSTVTGANVTELLNSPCDECVIKSFSTLTLCGPNACDESSTQCSDTDGGVQCQCLGGFQMSIFTDRLCIAITCPAGQGMVDKQCVECPFGFTGVECEEPWKLILVILGSTLGGLLLISIILVAVFASKSSKKKSKRNLNGNSSSSRFPASTQLHNSNFEDDDSLPGNRFGNGGMNGGVPRIPRATANDWGSRNNLEMTASNSRQNLIAPNHGQNNPYSINRPQINPYGENQGRTNSYYR